MTTNTDAVRVLREALEELYQMTAKYAITDSDYGIVCNAAAALAATEPAERAAIQPAVRVPDGFEITWRGGDLIDVRRPGQAPSVAVADRKGNLAEAMLFELAKALLASPVSAPVPEAVGPLVGCGDGNTRIVLDPTVVHKSWNAAAPVPEAKAEQAMTPMSSEECPQQWYFDDDKRYYIDVKKENGKYTIYLRDRSDNSEAYQEFAAPAVKHEAIDIRREITSCKDDVWTAGDDFTSSDKLPCAGIHVGAHGNAIEFYADTLEEAQKRRDSVLAARQAPSITVPAGSIGDDAEFLRLLRGYGEARTQIFSENVIPRMKQLVAYIDSRSHVAAPDTSASDAARYRWLRDRAPLINVAGPLVYDTDCDGYAEGITDPQKMDEIIDAAMSATAASSGEKGAT